MESALQSALLMGLFLVPCFHAQGTTDGSKKLQPVVVGLAAVMCFLFVIFAANLVNRLFCSKKNVLMKYGSQEDMFRDTEVAERRAASNIYENTAMEMEEGGSEATELKVEADKQTNL